MQCHMSLWIGLSVQCHIPLWIGLSVHCHMPLWIGLPVQCHMSLWIGCSVQCRVPLWIRLAVHATRLGQHCCMLHVESLCVHRIVCMPHVQVSTTCMCQVLSVHVTCGGHYMCDCLFHMPKSL